MNIKILHNNLAVILVVILFNSSRILGFVNNNNSDAVQLIQLKISCFKPGCRCRVGYTMNDNRISEACSCFSTNLCDEPLLAVTEIRKIIYDHLPFLIIISGLDTLQVRRPSYRDIPLTQSCYSLKYINSIVLLI